MTSKDDITLLLRAACEGDRAAVEQLIPLVYEDLHRIALARRRQWSGDETLNATVLVHEAYLRILDRTGATWFDRRHFYRVASRAMRQLLLNYAERKRAKKRGGPEAIDAASDPADAMDTNRADTIVAVDQVLDRLAEQDPQKARIVEFRFFGGLDNNEIGEALGLSSRTVQREWQRARAWLHAALDGGVAL